MSQSILQLIPGAPPQLNGVSDFAFAVARALRDNWAIESTFLVCSPSWEGPDTVDGFRLVPLRSRRGPDLCEAIQRISEARMTPLPVLLQLSSYGYGANGSPFWLLKGLGQWKSADPNARRLLTYFHELYATSMPWKRGFWVSPFQRYCTRQIAALSDFSLTSMHRYAETLAAWNPAKAGACAHLAIPSGVGELGCSVPFRDRRPQIVVFGSVGLRSRAYGGSRNVFSRICNILGIQEVVDIGEGEPGGLGSLPMIQVRKLGVLDAGDVGRILAESQYGYIDYFPGYLAKSSVFAAYCANGVVPVLPEANPSEADGLVAGKHYWCPDAGGLDMAIAQAIATEAGVWYSGHDVKAHARALAMELARV